MLHEHVTKGSNVPGMEKPMEICFNHEKYVKVFN